MKMQRQVRDEANRIMDGVVARKCKVCVTGAGGYIASWLVKNLLMTGYSVNATFRDPGNDSKTRHILCLPGAKERLRLFKADLRQEGSFHAAVEGCEYVFHLATPMDFAIEAQTQTNVIDAEVNGTLDILRTCSQAKSVRRVIYTSSITAASPLNDDGEFRDCLDESCWTPIDIMRREKPIFWMYYVAKTLAEQAALQYGSEDHGIEVVTIAPAIVAGPFLTPTLPASIEQELPFITGNDEHFEWLRELHDIMGSILLVHTEDVCNAHIFLMEHPSARGRYICSSPPLTLREMEDFCAKRYPQFSLPLKFHIKDNVLNGVPFPSRKLLDIGFTYQYGLAEILDDSIEFARKIGALP